MRRIILASAKGGVGKSTTATSLAVGLARRGRKVLALDLDPQSNTTWMLLRGQPATAPTMADVLLRRAGAEDAIRPTVVPNLDILPAAPDLAGVNVALVQELGRDVRLRAALAAVGDRWDIAVADTGPQVSTLLANGLVWASEVIVPVDSGIFSVLGLVELQGVVDEVRDAYGNAELRLAGLLLTKTARTAVHRDVEAELRARYGDLVFKATVPASVAVEAAHHRGQTIIEHGPKSPAALAYLGLVEEVLGDGDREANRGRRRVGRGAGASDAA